MKTKTASKILKRTSPTRALFDPFDKHDFSNDTCFLCGRRLTTINRSDEHIFAKWLLKKFSLFDKRLTLLNGTEIPYRHLTIPCCKVCNNKHLSKLEAKVRDVVEGRKPISAIDTETAYLWASKIFYGILYREVLLPLDRRSPQKGSIVSSDEMSRFRMLHVFLQATRIPIEFQCFHSGFPATIFMFKLQEPKTSETKFDFRDDIRSGAVYLRLGSIGIIAVFDAGAQAFEDYHWYRRYSKARLHPLQFEELGAALFYKASLFYRTPKMMITGDPRRGYHIMILPIAGASLLPVFQPWDHSVFAEYLAFFTGMPTSHLSPDGKSVMTFLRNAGSSRYQAMNIRKTPYKGLP